MSKDDANARGDSPFMTASAEPVALHPTRSQALPMDMATESLTLARQPADQAAFAFINLQRERVGLPAMGWQAGLAESALAHARYNARNGVSGHDEQPSMALYTGATSQSRIAAAWPTRFGAEIVADTHGRFAQSQDAIEGLFDAPFHRARVLSDALCVGAGATLDNGAGGQQSSLVVDFGGRRRAFRDSELIAYPFSGQPDAKTSWRAIETPNPLASAAPDLVGRVVGYPVTLNSAPDAWLSVRQFTIADPAGTFVPCVKADLTTNADDPDVATCVPVRPLKPFTNYTVSADGVLTRGTQVARDFHVSWTFTTGPAGAQDGLTDATPPDQRPSFEGP